MKSYDFIGLGLGPSNLSLAALMAPTRLTSHFLEKKKEFSWHSEVMFSDSMMQTSYLKDLVTSVCPTSPYSFLNYLVQNGLFHSFMNTHRTSISRQEYEQYCKWVSSHLSQNISFESEVKSIEVNNSNFLITTDSDKYISKHLCIGTGPTPNILDCAKSFLGPDVFHMKSHYMSTLNITNKRVLIIGGGQSGIEIFRNSLKNVWGRASSVKLITQRENLLPLDDSSFCDEYFTPEYTSQFLNLPQSRKDQIISSQVLNSDGNTPWYLEELYRDLYHLKNVEQDQRPIEILPMREVFKLEKDSQKYNVFARNSFDASIESFNADIIIMCTGFINKLPAYLDLISSRFDLDQFGRLKFNDDFSVKLDAPKGSKLFAVNFSRHNHGIADPQTSLMAWRSATIINSLLEIEYYPIQHQRPGFVRYQSHKAALQQESLHVSF